MLQQAGPANTWSCAGESRDRPDIFQVLELEHWYQVLSITYVAQPYVCLVVDCPKRQILPTVTHSTLAVCATVTVQ